MGHIFMAVVPYVVMSLLLLAAVFWLPAIATWLPKLIGLGVQQKAAHSRRAAFSLHYL